jgi:two-component system, chemotaxis family, protein-glutamate methylesterase/glutaminase
MPVKTGKIQNFKKRQKRKEGAADPFTIVLVGASAGGYPALIELLKHMPKDLNVAVFVVLHMSQDAQVSMLAKNAGQFIPHFDSVVAEDGATIKPQTVYFAPPGLHLMFNKTKVVLGAGADVNMFKPSIDVAFRSAAVYFRENVIGVILSGLLDDGVSGMLAVRDCGGVCIVQDPEGTAHKDLPVRVIAELDPLHILPVKAIGRKIAELSVQKRKFTKNIPDNLIREMTIAEKLLTGIDETRPIGAQSLYTCPDCGGVLFHISDHNISRYRCFTGHAFSEHVLMEKQTESIMLTLWVALRMFEERKKLMSQVSNSKNIIRRIDEVNHQITQIKELLSDIQKVTSRIDNEEKSTGLARSKKKKD